MPGHRAAISIDRDLNTMLEAHLVQTLVVYARRKDGDRGVSTCLFQVLFSLQKGGLTGFSDKVHFVYEQEHSCVRTVLLESCHTVPVIFEVLEDLSGFHVEDVYHDTDLFEDRSPLRGEIRVHERVLAAAVP